MWPWLASLAWSAQYLNFQKSLNLGQADTATTIFDGSNVLDGDLIKEVILPPELVAQMLDSETTVELEMELGCSGRFDYTCPDWDHVIQLFVCSGDKSSCQACPQLIWAENNASFPVHKNAEGYDQNVCGPEIARWMTPFRRRNGRWRSDISLLKAAFLHASNSCQFTMKSVTWAATGSRHWYPKLKLRVGSTEQKSFTSPSATPAMIPLFGSKTFDQHYNDRNPVEFLTPEGLESANIYALITGHGFDNNGCGEFCPFQNEFFINGQQWSLDFSKSGTQLGCTEAVRNGSLPNEHGTWFYGRSGWCDGMDVKPWIFDVSAFLAPAGGLNVIEYAGLFNGKTPNPTANAGQVLMSSYLSLEVGNKGEEKF